MIRALALILLAGSAQAQDAAGFDIDFARVFAEHPDSITRTGDTTRRIDLPGEVHVIETALSDGSHLYFGFDDSPLGAVGCTFRILVEASIAARACNGLLTQDQTATLDRNLDRAAQFVGANTVPPVPEAAIRDRLNQLLADRSATMIDTGIACPNGEDGNQQLLPMIETIASDRFATMLDAMFAVPRLPVAEPCM